MSFEKVIPEDTPGKMQMIDTTPTKGSTVPSVPRMKSNSMQSVESKLSRPLGGVAERNTPPLSFTSSNSKYNSTIDKLLEAGYNILNRLYNGELLTHLLAVTKLGDPVIIRVDSPKYREKFPK